MDSRRSFVKKSTLAGIAGVIAARKAPAYAQDMKKMKLGVLGVGSHGFAHMFKIHRKTSQKKSVQNPMRYGMTIPNLLKRKKATPTKKYMMIRLHSQKSAIVSTSSMPIIEFFWISHGHVSNRGNPPLSIAPLPPQSGMPKN